MDKCYYCGDSAPTEEHAPPRCIFPKLKDSPDGRDYRKNLIKVPSCEAHNTEKSKEDEYLLYCLVMSLPSNEIAKSQFLTKIMRAIQRRPKLIDRLLLQKQEVIVHDREKDVWSRTIAFKPEEQRLISIFTHIAKAIYYHEKKEKWDGTISVIIEFMLSFTNIEQNERQSDLIKELDTILSTVPPKGDNPDIFSYQFVEVEGGLFTRFHFYGNSKVVAAYVPTIPA